jgi:hypothetical protein
MFEQDGIRTTVQSYIDGYLTQDTELLKSAFHDTAKLMAIEDGKIDETATSNWFVKIDERRRAGSVRPKVQSEITDITYFGDAATARVILVFPEFQFRDFLSLLKGDQGWKIVNKIYTVKRLA